MLIKSTQEMRAFLGRAISSDFTFDSLKPYLELAQQDYLVKALGAEYWAILEAQAQNNEANPILPLVRRALAFYAYHKYLPYSIGLDSDNGLQETESDNTKPLRLHPTAYRSKVFGFQPPPILPMYYPWSVVRIGCSLVSTATLFGLKYPRFYQWLVWRL